MSKKCSLMLCFAVLSGVVAFGQKAEFTVVNRALSEEGGVVHLSEAPGQGLAWIKGLNFTEGTIEFDIKGRDLEQRSFVGFAFHGVSDSEFEAVYFRPFNFHSADPLKKVHHVQYVAEPRYDWKTLRETYPGKYEQPVSPAPDPNDWFHAKIVVGADKVEVFVNGSTVASLVVSPLLVHRGGKRAGYFVGESADGSWKNLRVNGSEVK